LIPHEQYPPPKKSDTKLNKVDYLIVGLTTFGVYTCMLTSSLFNLVLVILAWKYYERYRGEK